MWQLSLCLPNINKRLVKAPKVYLRDSGILPLLLQIDKLASLQSNHRNGTSWEGFALEQLIAIIDLDPEDLYFYRTHGGTEMDLIVRQKGKLYGFEFKATEKPSVTHSKTVDQKDLDLEAIHLVHPGELSFPLHDRMWLLGFQHLPCFAIGDSLGKDRLPKRLQHREKAFYTVEQTGPPKPSP